MGAGYLAAAYAVVHDKRLRTYVAEETKSMASGESHSEFVIRKRGHGHGD
jgi:predicted hydrocarbon binding protein